ncbi:MAG: uncharacterized SAM-binding protein YcdF (DUF218 family) [Candidatus Azotimanducaceae bacterium]|jgi:uncharacterized SAM-binding protein YcdF (DUF218 family)
MHDVLIVLGYSNDESDPVFQARVDKAVSLFFEGLAPQIIFSGCCSDKLDIRPKLTEAVSMRDAAIDQGIPPGIIFLEEESVDTLGNFYYSKSNFLEPCSWHHVGFVSSPWHTFRSEYLANMVLGPDYEVTGYASEHPKGWGPEDIQKSEQYNRLMLAQAKEQLGNITPGDHEAISAFLGTPPKG